MKTGRRGGHSTVACSRSKEEQSFPQVGRFFFGGQIVFIFGGKIVGAEDS